MTFNSAVLTEDIISGETNSVHRTAGLRLTSWLALLELREKDLKG